MSGDVNNASNIREALDIIIVKSCTDVELSHALPLEVQSFFYSLLCVEDCNGRKCFFLECSYLTEMPMSYAVQPCADEPQCLWACLV